MCDVMEVTWWLLELMFVCEMKLVKCLQCHGALQGRVNVSVCRSVGAGVCISVWHVRPTAGVLRGSHMWHSLAGVWNRDTGLQRRGPVLDTRPNISLCRTAASVSGVEEQVTGRHQRVSVRDQTSYMKWFNPYGDHQLTDEAQQGLKWEESTVVTHYLDYV